MSVSIFLMVVKQFVFVGLVLYLAKEAAYYFRAKKFFENTFESKYEKGSRGLHQ